MPWLQLSIETDEDRAPLLELVFEGLGALSVTLGDAGNQPLLEPKPGEERLWHATRVTALFEAERNIDELRAALNQALAADVSLNLNIERLEDQVWERTWLEHFKPMQFGQRLWICPDGQQVTASDAVLVKLDPGLAFGTGTHPTTALCLEWLEGQDLRGKRIIDYGCGSGILAIAALLLGAERAIAVDYDPQALEATQANAEKNGVAGRLEICLPEQTPQTENDLLLANILAGPLIELASTLMQLIQPGAPFALSGILQEQAEQVSAAYRPFAEMQPAQQQAEWIRLGGTKI
ncbi:50S ribosomal protein L11 methyltransferase [endosymbiont of Riftia pachyptila]|uniref:Ribosomal protein L11 methyltransferase n=1 Tax=endosymbiont of Riftia pachyptila (vent Ph05) TaxID=1048808 RepID=G2DDS3_9GAMM|nr:50S ribosomal protein L11 methyltransferase [endosymbiont of Riftia pachyptila]EGV51245.1 ribosomal protein L11 methyltransferase [endosymbiont of Riftia pachyptila (vent Ph05)]